MKANKNVNNIGYKFIKNMSRRLHTRQFGKCTCQTPRRRDCENIWYHLALTV